MIDAKEVSAAHRARYFWGNLPGMNRWVRAPGPGVAAGGGGGCRQDGPAMGIPEWRSWACCPLTSLLLGRVLLRFLLEEGGELG